MSSETPSSSIKLFSFIENAGKTTAVVASFALVVSVFYDWGFFSALGLQFSEAPTSVSDHVRSWIVWLPKASLSILGVLIFEMLTKRIEKGMTEGEIIESSPNPSVTHKRRQFPFKLLKFSGILIVVSWVVFGDAFQAGLTLGLIISWFTFSFWVFNQQRVLARFSDTFRILVHWAPPIVIWFYFSGSNDALLRIHSSQSSVVQIKAQRDFPETVRMVRSFERWLLVKDANNRVFWISSEDVLRIERGKDPTPFRGIACWASRALCVPPN
jgi:hypothetical protein